MKNKWITLVSKRFSTEQCRVNFDTLFVFGDSLERYGSAGQACIRGQENSVGLATKKKPGMSVEDFFTDAEYDENCKIIDSEVEKIKAYAELKGYVAISFPFHGLGTGLSSMQTNCPKTFCYLTIKLVDEFQFNNISALKSE